MANHFDDRERFGPRYDQNEPRYGRDFDRGFDSEPGRSRRDWGHSSGMGGEPGYRGEQHPRRDVDRAFGPGREGFSGEPGWRGDYGYGREGYGREGFSGELGRRGGYAYGEREG